MATSMQPRFGWSVLDASLAEQDGNHGAGGYNQTAYFYAHESPAGGATLPIASRLYSELLLCPQNRVLCHLGDSELDDGLSRNFDLLLCLRIEAHASLPFLLYELAKAGQDEFAFLFDRFVGEVAERIEEYSSGLFVCLSGCSERGLKFCLGHL